MCRTCVRTVNDLWLIPMRFCLALFFVISILGKEPAAAALLVAVILVPLTKKFVKKLR